MEDISNIEVAVVLVEARLYVCSLETFRVLAVVAWRLSGDFKNRIRICH